MSERLTATLEPAHAGFNLCDLAPRRVHDAARAAARSTDDSIKAWHPARLQWRGVLAMHVALMRDLGFDPGAC